jgi:predicted phage terminase large subunit-like protein
MATPKRKSNRSAAPAPPRSAHLAASPPRRRSPQYTERQKEALRFLGSGAETLMIFGGAGSGKTYLLTTFIALAISAFPGLRCAVLRRQFKDARESVMGQTFPAVMKQVCGLTKSAVDARINRRDFCYREPNGSEIWFGGLDDSARLDNILGKEYGLIYFNECSQIGYTSFQTALGRIRQKIPGWRNRAILDCNPPSKAHWIYKTFILKQNPDNTPLARPEDYAAMKMNPGDNARFLPEGYIEKRLQTMTGKEYKRFFLGEFTDDVQNALWTRAMIDPYRVASIPDDLEKVVIGVDPAVTSGEHADLTGIVAVGRRYESGRTDYFVLEDTSGRMPPADWAGAVGRLYEKYGANEVICEVNQGGDLVTEILRGADYRLPVRAVRASKGKRTRAEPIAVLYQNGAVHHVGGNLKELEDELTSFTGAPGETSPDRLDALVWAMTGLTEERSVTGGYFWFT